MRFCNLLIWTLVNNLQLGFVGAQPPVCVNQSQVDQSATLPYFQARFPNITVQEPKPYPPPWLGGRNSTFCCIQAVDEYLRNNCSNTADVRVSDKLLRDDSLFPCGALWNGDVQGAPLVEVTYNWTTYNCEGWQVSQPHKVSEWAQLLVSFILPAVVFSFNIPRPRKLKVWEKLFPKDLGSYRVIGGLAGAVVAAISVTLDAVTWLIFSFAFAGPLLLSGLYEATLDKRVLHYLEEHIKHDKLPLAFRARVLFTILCGNLDLYPAWSDTMDLARHLDELDRYGLNFVLRQTQTQTQNKTPFIHISYAKSEDFGPSSNTSRMGHSRAPSIPPELDRISFGSHRDSTEGYDDTEPLQSPVKDESQPSLGVIARDFSGTSDPTNEASDLTKIRTASSAGASDMRSLTELNSTVNLDPYKDRARTVRKVAVRLKAMLACQYSFGTTIGGPVVFFLGSFIYALLEIRDNTGDENVAEALAFGMWWIIIPHVAVVAGLLLAGNNPNILEGIVSIRELKYAVGESLMDRQLERRGTIDAEVLLRTGLIEPGKKKFSEIMERVYKANYSPAWMWDRGKCKQDWLLVLFTDSWLKYQVNDRLTIRKELEHFLNDAVMLNSGDWLFLWSFAFSLLFIPCMFGFLTAYYTPVIGIGCRAMTFLIYMGAQTLLLLLWTYYLTWRDQYWATAQRVKRALRSEPHHSTEQQIKTYINKLRMQAVKDTTMSKDKRRRLNARASVSSLSAEIDILAAQDQLHPVPRWIFYILCALGFTISLFSSIGGTLMQITGIYRNSLCLLRADYWISTNRSSTYVTLSTNTYEAIANAQGQWLIIGSCSVVFLGVVCYAGWWYQKRLRAIFHKIAGQLDGDQRDRELNALNYR